MRKLIDLYEAMKNTEADFFKHLGERIAQLRREQNLTQAELADMLTVKQQVVASYEVGRRRVPVSMMPALAHSLGVSVEELMGVQNGNGKRGPTPKLQRQVEQIAKLPKAKQRFVSELLDNVLQKPGT